MADFILKNNAFDYVDKVLTEKGFIKKPINGNQGTKYNSPEGGNIDVYCKSGNVVIGGTHEKRDLLKKLFLDLFGEFLTTEPQKTIPKQNMVFRYSVPISQILGLKSELEKFVQDNQYALQGKSDEKAYYRFEITDSKQKDRVVITQFKTSTLLMQGLESELWFEISNFIGHKLNITFQTIVAQIVAEPDKETEVITIVTENDQAKAELEIKARLGDCYLFLYPHDRNAVEASQYMLDSGLQPKDYFGFVSPTIRAIEGFAKKLFIYINAFTEGEIRKTGDEGWKFSKVYDRESKQLTPKVLNCLSSDPKIKELQEKRIKDLVIEGIFKIRHPHFHDGPPTGTRVITNLTDARSIHDELLGLMVKVYECFKSELNK